jgi:hypothetical protein
MLSGTAGSSTPKGTAQGGTGFQGFAAALEKSTSSAKSKLAMGNDYFFSFTFFFSFPFFFLLFKGKEIKMPN